LNIEEQQLKKELESANATAERLKNELQSLKNKQVEKQTNIDEQLKLIGEMHTNIKALSASGGEANTRVKDLENELNKLKSANNNINEIIKEFNEKKHQTFENWWLGKPTTNRRFNVARQPGVLSKIIKSNPPTQTFPKVNSNNSQVIHGSPEQQQINNSHKESTQTIEWMSKKMIQIMYIVSRQDFATNEEIRIIHNIFNMLMKPYYAKEQSNPIVSRWTTGFISRLPEKDRQHAELIQIVKDLIKFTNSPFSLAITVLSSDKQTEAIQMFTNYHKAILSTAVRLGRITITDIQNNNNQVGGTVPMLPLVMYKMSVFENLGMLVEYSSHLRANPNRCNTFLLRILDACAQLSINKLYVVQGDLAQSAHVKGAYNMFSGQTVPTTDARCPVILMFAWLVLKTIAIYGNDDR
jgi:hypothetical protein